MQRQLFPVKTVKMMIPITAGFITRSCRPSCSVSLTGCRAILRKGVHLEGGDQEYWQQWSKDVTGDGTPLNEFCRRWLVDALLFGHSNCVVDFPAGDQPQSLAEERQQNRKPYLVSVPAQVVRGWRTERNRSTAELTMVRYIETLSIPKGEFGEELIQQVRVLKKGSYQVWRDADQVGSASASNSGWDIYEQGELSLERIPFVTLYSNQIATLVSKPPLQEVAELAIRYQRFTDYFHSIHVGAQPILCLKGFDPESGENDLDVSVNTAVLCRLTAMRCTSSQQVPSTRHSWSCWRPWKTRSAPLASQLWPVRT